MELSSDNIEELATVLNSCNTHDQQLDVFGTKSNHSTLDVDRVISEAQDSLLNSSLEAIRSSDVPCSFNDILDDICKMNNNIELQQAAVHSAATTTQLPLETPAYYHMPDLEMQSENYTSECSFSNQTDFLQPLGAWSEYLPLPPSSLSRIQDIPQLAPIPTTIPSPPPPPPPVPVEETPQINYVRDVATVNVNSIAEEKKADSSVPPALPVAPMQFFNNYNFTIPVGMVNNQSTHQIEIPNTNLHFTQAPEGNINFMMHPNASAAAEAAPQKRIVQHQTPFPFDWARVIPRRSFIQPSEIVVLRPLRTRKVMSSSRPSFDLASYFDTSTISIPMIRERPRSRTYRRKQKLYTIPGADNLVFEVQLDPSSSENKNDNNNNNEEQLYPETEIPELDEIFKRKRRILHTRRNPPHQDRIKTTSSPQSIEKTVPKEIVQKEVSPAPSPNNYKEQESLSDADDDIDSDDVPLSINKSMKCANCRKLFKTCRSLTIHSKRCKSIRPRSPPIPKIEELQELVEPPKTTSKISVQSRSKKEITDLKKPDEGKKVITTRPLTRSQTRNALKRKLSVDDGGGSQKKSK